MTSPAAVARIVRRMLPPRPRVGFVTAVDLGAQLVTVAFEDGSSTSSLSWASSAYASPAVGDRVLAVPTTTGWVVLSKVTPRPVLVTSQQAVVSMTKNWMGSIEDGSSTWFWSETIAAGYAPGMQQGVAVVAHGGDDKGGEPGTREVQASALYWGSLASLVPSGATIQQVTVRVRRNSQDLWGDPALVQPVMYGHAYTTTPSGAPSWVAGYGPIRFPALGRGEEATLTLPAAWVTAWLAGTITGIGFYATTPGDHMAGWEVLPAGTFNRDTGVLTITYTGGTT